VKALARDLSNPDLIYVDQLLPDPSATALDVPTLLPRPSFEMAAPPEHALLDWFGGWPVELWIVTAVLAASLAVWAIYRSPHRARRAATAALIATGLSFFAAPQAFRWLKWAEQARPLIYQAAARAGEAPAQAPGKSLSPRVKTKKPAPRTFAAPSPAARPADPPEIPAGPVLDLPWTLPQTPMAPDATAVSPPAAPHSLAKNAG
jgi:hypothetical protein